MKVAILGAGLGGLATGWFLKHYTLGQARVDFYDPNPLGAGASRISLGLLHPYMGRHARRNTATTRCLREVHRLITEAAKETHSPIVTARGIMRPAITDEAIQTFQERAAEYDDIEWLDKQTAETEIPGLTLPDHGGALYIKEGLTLNMDTYMEGLWLASARHAAQFKQMTVLSKEQLAPYDRVLIALGANCLDFDVLKGLPMTRVKGQVIQLEWPEDLSPLKMSLAGEGQIVMAPDYKSCYIGSTYEHNFKDMKAYPTKAREEIMRKVLPFYPVLKDAKMLSCRARMRASSQSRLPLIGQLNEKVWFLTGLGSKGLFYHAWAGKMTAQSMLTNDTRYIHPQFLCQFQVQKTPQKQS